QALCARLPELPGGLILVSNETSLGIVPVGALTRRYLDCAGALHRRVAAEMDRVVLLVAGLPLTLKGSSWPLLSFPPTAQAPGSRSSGASPSPSLAAPLCHSRHWRPSSPRSR